MNDMNEFDIDYDIDPELEHEIYKINNKIAEICDEKTNIMIGYINKSCT